MTENQLLELFKTHEDEYIKFERVKNKLTNRADLHAFILLDKLCPGRRDLVCGTNHDEIFLSVKLEELAKTATEEDVVTVTSNLHKSDHLQIRC